MTTPSEPPRNVTTPRRALTALLAGAFIAALLTGLIFAAPGVFARPADRTVFDWLNHLVGVVELYAGFGFLFAVPGLALIGGPLWLVLHRTGHRSMRHAMILGAVLAFAATFVFVAGFYGISKPLDALASVAIAAVTGVVGALTGAMIWTIAYRPADEPSHKSEPHYDTNLKRAAIGLVVGVLTGAGQSAVLLVILNAITLPADRFPQSFGALALLAVPVFFVSLVILGGFTVGMLVIAAPCWVVLHRLGARARMHAMALGAVLLFLTAALVLPFSGVVHLCAALIGAVTGMAVWKAAYRPVETAGSTIS